MKNDGYVLVSVLVALVLISFVATRLDERVDAIRTSQEHWLGWGRTKADLSSAQDVLLFDMVTHPMTQWGFGPGAQGLRVDGRTYRMDNDVLISVQDMRGLMSIAIPNTVMLRNFLLQNGVADKEVSPLLDKLADYMDNNNLRRLNGAEKDDYQVAGMPEPRNDWPISAYELRQIMGWAELPQIWSVAGDMFTASREEFFNPNTAPPEVLRALPGATDQAVAAIMHQREVQCLSAADVLGLTGIVLDDSPVNYHPGRFYRLRAWRADSARALESVIMLTPGAPRLPWLILEARFVGIPSRVDQTTVARPYPFPHSPALDAGDVQSAHD